jgi:signal transduction histidine kinase
MYLQRMVLASQTMEQIVSRLHQYVRLATHHLKLSRVPIAQLTGEITAQYRSLPPGTNLHWHTNPDLAWSSDSFLLETIVQELLSNALLYCITPAQVNITWNLIQDELVLTVSDQGIGIAPEYQQRVFNLFERLHGRESYPGAGVGLTMVLKSVSLLNGRIELASATDQGTQIRVSLPRAPINPT